MAGYETLEDSASYSPRGNASQQQLYESLIAQGTSPAQASILAGITPSTLANWSSTEGAADKAWAARDPDGGFFGDLMSSGVGPVILAMVGGAAFAGAGAGGAAAGEGAAAGGAAAGEGGALALDVGGGAGLGEAAAYAPWEEGFAGTGALTDSATVGLGGAAEAGLGAEVDPMLYGGGSTGTWGTGSTASLSGLGAEVDPMAYGGGGESATWGATEGGMPTNYDAVNGMDLNSDIATNTGVVPEGSINAGLTTTGGLPSVGPTLDGTGGLPGGGGSPTGTPPGTGGLGLPGGIPWSTLLQGLGGIGSGLSGMQAGKDVASAMDPFGKYRNDYADKLNALWNDPSTITKMPGDQAGLTAVERSLGAQGYTGSGNMMAALSEYGGGQFDKTLQELMTLSGANAQPGAGAVAGANLNSAGQGSLGYGLAQLLKGLGGGGRSGGTGVQQYGTDFDPSLFTPSNMPAMIGP